MKTVLVLGLVLASVAKADLGSDRNQIRAMSGCYEVTFHFVETGTTDPHYPIRSKEYTEHGLEWVEIDRDEGTLLSLQHILITPNGPLKHWRQQWEYEPTNALYFKGNATWKTESISPELSAGKWIQRVYQVDDSPRYECVSAWNGSEWQCSTYAPLPRREFSQRSDYNVLDRTNKHIITADGWLHDQDNRKLIVTEQGATQIATEKGLDTYRKVDDSRCLSARTYWSQNKRIWNVIQDMWSHMRSHHPDFSLKPRVNNKLLWESLFELADVTAQEVQTLGTLDEAKLKKLTHDIVHQYMIVKEEHLN